MVKLADGLVMGSCAYSGPLYSERGQRRPPAPAPLSAPQPRTQNQTLTASSTLADVDGLGSITCQWKAGGVVIAGANTNTLVQGAAQVGKTITATARYTDGQGTVESVASMATSAVAASNAFVGTVDADTLIGLAGNDTYVANNVSNVVIENVNEGADLVQASISYTLAANVENLTLIGTSAISGNTDVARFDTGIATDQLWFVKTGNNLDVSIIGTSDKLTMTNWYLGSQYHVEQFKTSDGKTLLDSQVQNLVSAMAAFAPAAAGETTLSASYAASLNPVIAANWQ